MNYKVLGSTDLKVSELAFGGVEIGVPYGLSVSDDHKLLTEQEAIHLLRQSLDSGINFYDTARLYGRSEEIMGKAFEENRQQIIYATKCRHFRRADGTLPAKSEFKSIIEQSLQESLSALKTDYVDVFMLHYADLEILEIDEIYQTFENLQRSGAIRSPGISIYEPEETALALRKDFWKAIQLPFNLLDQRQAAYFGEAKEKGVGIIVRSVLMRGLLTDKSFDLHPALKKVQDHIYLYKQLFNAERNNLATLASKFVASFEEVSSVLVGIDKIAYLEEALQNFDGKYLSEGDFKLAKTLGFKDQGFLNLAQWDKNGWL